MKRTPLEMYALAICFICVFAMVLNVGQAAYSLVQMSRPQTTLSRDFETRATRSNDSYWKWLSPSSDKPQPARPPEEELTKRRLELRADLYDEESSKGQGKLASSLIFLLCFGVVFLLHWSLARKSRLEHHATGA